MRKSKKSKYINDFNYGEASFYIIFNEGVSSKAIIEYDVDNIEKIVILHYFGFRRKKI